MNTFAEIIPIEELSKGKVRYYSLKCEGKDETMFESFLRRCCSEQPPSFETQALLETLAEIGERGAKSYYFKEENRAERIKANEKKFKSLKAGRLLRLYCWRLDEATVVLLGGAVKSSKVYTAQDCPSVSPYFRQA